MHERVLVIDNYDSFTHNLVQYLGEVGADTVQVFRNDRITVEGIAQWKPSHLVISPGPGTPDEAGVSVEAVRGLAGKVPVLGVCLGYQAIARAFGGRVARGNRPVHGKVSPIHHDGRTIYRGIPVPFEATRYHSLVLADPLPSELEPTAWSGDGVLMGVRHREFAVEGVLFHPESILTAPGRDILRNFLDRGGPPGTAAGERRGQGRHLEGVQS